MNKFYQYAIDYDIDDIDSDFDDIIKSLRFRNRPDRKSFRVHDDEVSHKRKRNHHRPRIQETEAF